MSSPATPKRVASGSEERSQSPLSTILTPGRKVKALLAQFDDETGSENESRQGSSSNRLLNRTESPSEQRPSNLFLGNIQKIPTDGEDDEDVPIAPRGTMASRMQAQAHAETCDPSKESIPEYDASSRLKARATATGKANEHNHDKSTSSSEDEIALPRRRLQRRKQSDRSNPASPNSPMFFPSVSVENGSVDAMRTRFDSAGSENEDLPANVLEDEPKSRFLKLVEEHRKRRQEKEAIDKQKRQERLQDLEKHSHRSIGQDDSDSLGSSDEGDDADNGARMMRQSRPTRGASKKALEEMRREQQRIHRNMQLAHQVKTKKRITKESLLARFNFPAPDAGKNEAKSSARKLSSLRPASETEGRQAPDTPPTSLPPMHPADEHSGETRELYQVTETTPQMLRDEEDLNLPTADNFVIEHMPLADKGKGKAIEQDTDEALISTATEEPISKPMIRPIRVQFSKECITRNLSSDDELDIVSGNPATRKIEVFEKLPKMKAKETPSHLILRSLAHLHAPTATKKQYVSMTSAEMDSSLRRQARLQAAKERAAKIEELKAKGIVVQSAEEREKEQQEVEDLVEKARQEGADIARREKELAKRNGELVQDHLEDSEDDEEDADFLDNDNAGDSEGSISGEQDDTNSENGEDEGEGDFSNEDGQSTQADGENMLIANEAEEQGSDEETSEEGTDAEDDPGSSAKITPMKSVPRSRKSRIVSDDEDVEDQASEKPQLAKTPQSVIRSVQKRIPGLPMSDDLPMALSQAFAATMADSQPGTEMEAETQEPDSLTMLQDMPDPETPIVPRLSRLETYDNIADSQSAPETQPLNVDLSFTQPTNPRRMSLDASQAVVSSTQFSEPPEPTQDVGYVLSPWMERRFDTPQQPPYSTIETIILPQDESPMKQRKGRLRRRLLPDSELDGVEAEAANKREEAAKQDDQYLIDPSAFDVMRRASSRLKTHQLPPADTEKAKAEAKNMVEEAAEESEDEYAGLGGASDDDAGEEEEEDRMMINDDGKEKLNERMIAQLHADKERSRDEATVSKLLKDITTGALRRKRGAADDLELSDEEDAHARRQEAKRREFARMRRELLKSDERIEKIAEDPRKTAFLRAIEDLEDEEEGLDERDESQDQKTESQPREAPTEVSQPQANTVLQPALLSVTNRLPISLRRTAKGSNTNTVASNNMKKPASLADIRESLSFLIEEPDSQNGAGPASSDSELDEDQQDRTVEGKENDDDDDDDDEMADFIVEDSQPSAAASTKAHAIFKKPPVPPPRAPGPQRRTKVNTQRTDVVDRLSLLRQRSSGSTVSSLSVSSTIGSRMAFMSGAGGPFPVLSLLRRATTSSSSLGSDAGMTTERQMAEAEGKKKGSSVMGARVRAAMEGKRNAVNFRGRMVKDKALGGAGGMSARNAGEPTGMTTDKRNSIQKTRATEGFLKEFLGSRGGGIWNEAH